MVKKTKLFCSTQCPKQNETIQEKKVKDMWKIVYLNSGALSWRRVTARDARCDAPVIWWGHNLAIGLLYVCIYYICVCVCFGFVGNVAVSEWLPSVWMHISVWLQTVCKLSMWMLSYDGPLLTIWSICMIIICMDAHQRVITDCMTMCGNISVAYVWQSEYVLQYVAYYIQSYFFPRFFLFITQIILIVFF